MAVVAVESVGCGGGGCGDCGGGCGGVTTNGSSTASSYPWAETCRGGIRDGGSCGGGVVAVVVAVRVEAVEGVAVKIPGCPAGAVAAP